MDSRLNQIHVTDENSTTVVGVDDVVQLSDGFFYPCYKACSQESGCSVSCGRNVCRDSDAKCNATVQQYVQPMYELSGNNMNVYANNVLSEDTFHMLRNGKVYVPRNYIHDKISNDNNTRAFMTTMAYIDQTNQPRLYDMVNFKPDVNSCVKMQPCAGLPSQQGVCCGATNSSPLYQDGKIAAPLIPKQELRPITSVDDAKHRFVEFILSRKKEVEQEKNTPRDTKVENQSTHVVIEKKSPSDKHNVYFFVSEIIILVLCVMSFFYITRHS